MDGGMDAGRTRGGRDRWMDGGMDSGRTGGWGEGEREEGLDGWVDGCREGW